VPFDQAVPAGNSSGESTAATEAESLTMRCTPVSFATSIAPFS
jgi:hypothetical protein